MSQYNRRATPQLRTALTALVDMARAWQNPDPAVIVEALWLIALDGVPGSGVRKGTNRAVLSLVLDVAHGKIPPADALARMRGE